MCGLIFIYLSILFYNAVIVVIVEVSQLDFALI